MKRLLTLLVSLSIASLTHQVKGQELGVYISPFGAGYSEFNYQLPEVTTPFESRGLNASPNAFVTLRVNRLRLGAEAGFSGVGIRDIDVPTGIQPTVQRRTHWRTMYMGGGRIGFDLIQAPFFHLSPAFTLGTFRTVRDDFNETMSNRMFTKFSMLLEFRGATVFSVFLEPSFSRFSYDSMEAPDFSGRMYNYNLNLGIAFRL
ncbi:hypothetical protein RCC89_08210 [Cytophagaceae bacterium ABcell3]|nr:hypothetical protein RCC89_08210 [Cytophagaceae bacterium ABcell3]